MPTAASTCHLAAALTPTKSRDFAFSRWDDFCVGDRVRDSCGSGSCGCGGSATHATFSSPSLRADVCFGPNARYPCGHAPCNSPQCGTQGAHCDNALVGSDQGAVLVNGQWTDRELTGSVRRFRLYRAARPAHLPGAGPAAAPLPHYFPGDYFMDDLGTRAALLRGNDALLDAMPLNNDLNYFTNSEDTTGVTFGGDRR